VSAAAGLLHWLEAMSDRLSPLVVKEARQLVRGREFLLSFGSSLLVGLTVAAFGAASALSGSSTSGRWTFALLMGGLALLGLAVVPLGAFSTLRQERLEQTLDLITLTSLTPRRIVIGKLLAQAVKLMILFAAIAPFIMMSFLLGGIDLATILVSLVVLFMASVWVSAFFLLVSATSQSRAVSAMVFGAVAIVALFGIPFVRSLLIAMSRGLVPGAALIPVGVPWRMVAIMFTFWLASLVNLVLLAENRLSSPTGDAVTPLRQGLLAQFLLIVGWALTYIGDSSAIRLSTGRALMSAGTVHLAVVAYFAVTEDFAVARRIWRRMNVATRWRWLLATFGPGGGRAAAYVLVQMCALGAALALLEPPAEHLRWVAAACGYICFFTGVPILLFRKLAPAHDTQIRRRVAVLLTVAAALVLPDIIDYALWQDNVLNVAFSLRHLINPFRALANWSVIEMNGWLVVPAFIGLIGVLSWMKLIQEGTRGDGDLTD
jgi:hypothetical protein